VGGFEPERESVLHAATPAKATRDPSIAIAMRIRCQV
jgi:hypothetical protein